MDYPGLLPFHVQVQNKAENLMSSTSAEDADDLSSFPPLTGSTGNKLHSFFQRHQQKEPSSRDFCMPEIQVGLHTCLVSSFGGIWSLCVSI